MDNYIGTCVMEWLKKQGAAIRKIGKDKVICSVIEISKIRSHEVVTLHLKFSSVVLLFHYFLYYYFH